MTTPTGSFSALPARTTSFGEVEQAVTTNSESEATMEAAASRLPESTRPLLKQIEAMRRARTLQEELERAKVGLALAVDGAIAAVDQDGDGQISVEEALQAPSRVVGWLGVWREIVARGKL